MTGVVYFSTVSGADAQGVLREALASLLRAFAADQEPPKSLYELYFEQKGPNPTTSDFEGQVFTFPHLHLDLAFNDATIAKVKPVWKTLMNSDETITEADYMNFDDREGADDEDAFG